MIRTFQKTDLEAVLCLWLKANKQAHGFIAPSYWEMNLENVRKMIPEAEVFVHVSKDVIDGFIGLNGTYIAGIFVEGAMRGKGIGTKLLDHVKKMKNELSLDVYEKNKRAEAFYKREGFVVCSMDIDKETKERQLHMEWRRRLRSPEGNRVK